MFILTKTRFYGSDAFRIVSDDWDCFNSFGPFFDILDCYAAETKIAPKQVQWIYQYQFIEDKRKTEFYWDGVSTSYVFNIAPFQYQKIHERLKKICADLNRRINGKKRLKRRDNTLSEEYNYLPNIYKPIFKLNCPKEKNVIEVMFNGWECIRGCAPLTDIMEKYSELTGLLPKRVQLFFNYMFVEDDFNIQFFWDDPSTVYVFYIAPEQYDLIYNRLKKICGELNREIRENLKQERKNMIYREPPPYYRDRRY